VPGIYPNVRAYIDRLPDGLASYPECMAKVALVRDLIESRPLDPSADHVPDELRRMLATPPPLSSWIPEAHFVAMSLTIFARDFGATDFGAFEDWICTRNMALFRKPLYRVLIALMSPERLLVGTSKRWTAFHLGTTLSVIDHGPGSARLKIAFPPHLYGHEMLRGMSAGLRAAVNVAGGRNVAIGIDDETPTSAEYWLRWET
jgi:hypothetical protein